MRLWLEHSGRVSDYLLDVGRSGVLSVRCMLRWMCVDCGGCKWIAVGADLISREKIYLWYCVGVRVRERRRGRIERRGVGWKWEGGCGEGRVAVLTEGGAGRRGGGEGRRGGGEVWGVEVVGREGRQSRSVGAANYKPNLAARVLLSNLLVIRSKKNTNGRWKA